MQQSRNFHSVDCSRFRSIVEGARFLADSCSFPINVSMALGFHVFALLSGESTDPDDSRSILRRYICTMFWNASNYPLSLSLS